MKVQVYLIISSSGSVRTAKHAPKLQSNEISLWVNISLPVELFRKPQLQATITVPDDAALPSIIDAGIIDNIQEIVKQNSGIELKISVTDERDKSG